MQELTGSANPDAAQDIYAAALRNDIDPAQTENDAQQVLYEIGGQFDSGEFDRLGPPVFSAMRLVALSWARIGWAKFLRDENLPAVRFLMAAWQLSQSGTVANRLAQVLEKQGQTARAQHMYALAIAAGGAEDVQDARRRLTALGGELAKAERAKADPVKAEKEAAHAREDLAQERTVKLVSITSKPSSARFNLVFDGSPRPERAEFIDGDESLRFAFEQMREKDFPVRFPDASSVKIIRQARLNCSAAECSVELLPTDK
jgi:hypothetical protein